MKKGALILLIAILSGACAFMLVRTSISHAKSGSLLDTMPELSWVKSEFELSDDQFEKVQQLHEAYRPECVAMCERIWKAHERLDKAARGGKELTPELSAAINDHAQVHAECQQKMMHHLYQTAAVMNEDQAKRYLDEMLPYALDFSHSEPEDVHVQKK